MTASIKSIRRKLVGLLSKADKLSISGKPEGTPWNEVDEYIAEHWNISVQAKIEQTVSAARPTDEEWIASMKTSLQSGVKTAVEEQEQRGRQVHPKILEARNR